MYNTFTNTSTYTVSDIRKTFENFDADFRMIALRTGKKSIDEVEKYVHDILLMAENKYLDFVDITLVDLNSKPIKAARYRTDENGKALQSQRAGNNNEWQNIPNTILRVVMNPNTTWNNKTQIEKNEFIKKNGFLINWGASDVDTSYKHLSKEDAQLYASKGYELKKENFK